MPMTIIIYYIQSHVIGLWDEFLADIYITQWKELAIVFEKVVSQLVNVTDIKEYYLHQSNFGGVEDNYDS